MVRGRPRILLIEADVGVGRMFLLALRSAGFDPIHVTAGADALQALETTGVEAVVLDPDLPDGLGGQVLSRLKNYESRGNAPLPWVVVSSQEIDHLIVRYGPVGDRFLAKPFNPWDLIEFLRGSTA